MKPIVAVVGRPNVGKSTLVNRIIGRREAIVQEQPGVTRDRKAVDADWSGRAFTLVDTGGWLATDAPLDRQVSKQAERAMAEATAILFVVDTAIGVTDEDDRVAGLLRRTGTPVVVVANKVDSQSRANDIWAFSSFGLGDPMPVSALHGHGTGELLDQLIELFPDGGAAGRTARRRCRACPRSPSSAVRTSASRRSTTGSSATSARSSTTCRARRAMPSTR